MSKHTAIRRSTLVSSIAMLLVAVMALSGATYAWFSARDSADAQGLDMTASSASGLYIAETGINVSSAPADSEFSSLITWNKIDTPFIPVSGTAEGGAGASFYTTTSDKTDGTYNGADVNSATANVNYVAKRIWIKADTNDEISVKIGLTVGGTSIKGYERVAIYYNDGNNETSDTTIFANDTAQYNAIVSSTPTYEPVTPSVFNTGKTITGIFDEAKYIDVIVWFEGQDTDCTNVRSGANMNLSLSFAKAAA